MSGTQCVTVGWRACDRLGRERASGTWPIFDDELLGECVAETLSDDARDAVGVAAGRKRYDDLDRLLRPALGLRRLGRAVCIMQSRRQPILVIIAFYCTL
jgi:hypothetical protein